MHLKVKLFGPHAQSVGERQVSLDLPGPTCTCGEVRQLLTGRFPHLKEMFSTGRLAVNCEFAQDTQTIASGDEVAFIGPVSGG